MILSEHSPGRVVTHVLGSGGGAVSALWASRTGEDIGEMAAGVVIKSLFDPLVSVEARWLRLLAARTPASDSSLLTAGSTCLVEGVSPACACCCCLTAVGRHRTLFTWTSRARVSGASNLKPARHRERAV